MEILHLDLGGIDLLMMDIRRSWRETGADGRLCVGATSDAGMWLGGWSIRAGCSSVFKDVCGLLPDACKEVVLIVADGREFMRIASGEALREKLVDLSR